MDVESMNGAKKVVLVTGGSAGIGAKIAHRFLETGAIVVTCSRSTPQTLPTANGNTVHHICTDVRDNDAINQLIQETMAQFGRLDVVVNNAGGAPFCTVADASPRLLEKVIQLNLLAPLLVARAANAVMQKQSTGGTIINIASVSGTRPSPGTAAYGAAKAGLLNLTETLAVEWAPRVRVVAVTAGLIQTEKAHLHYGNEAGIQAAAGTVPLQRLGIPDDVANTVLFLASDRASYISGTSITLHGGGARPAFLDAVQRAMEATESHND